MKTGEFELFEHKADIGIRGFGKTLEEAFENGAKAMFSIMVNIEKIKPEKEIKIVCKAEDKESLFIDWLNNLLAESDLEGMVFSEFKVKIKKENSGYVLEGRAKGENLNKERHEVKTEVKAATYAELKIKKENNIFIAQTVVDV